MHLIIDNSSQEKILFFISKKNAWEKHEYPAGNDGALLRSLESLLAEQRLTPSDLSGIAVRVGEGSFTATRIAVTAANTLAYSLKIPVIAVKTVDLEEVASLLKNTPVGQYATALYSAEPRIGKKK